MLSGLLIAWIGVFIVLVAIILIIVAFSGEVHPWVHGIAWPILIGGGLVVRMGIKMDNNGE